MSPRPMVAWSHDSYEERDPVSSLPDLELSFKWVLNFKFNAGRLDCGVQPVEGILAFPLFPGCRAPKQLRFQLA
jgi:hypothetical protein